MATAFNWKVDFFSAGSWVTLPNVQDLNIFRGRRLQIDDYSIDTMTVDSIFPSTWATAPKLGDVIIAYIYKTGAVIGTDNFAAFWGRVRDVKINYGMVPNDDRVTIECEGLQADWGRVQLNDYALAEDRTDEQLLQVASTVGLSIGQFDGRSIGSALTYTGNAFNLVNIITRTEEARMYAGSASYHATPTIFWFGRNTPKPTTFHWNDGTGAPYLYQLKYDEIEFRSSADNYYTSVTITPAAVAEQTATLGVTPIYGQNKDTIDYSTAQAADHALWVLNNFQSKDQTLASITFTDVQQINNSFGQFNTDAIMVITSAINSFGRVYFRGQTFNTILEGISISATANQTRVTVYMSGQDTNAYLILDDAIYGKLDNNKLGF
jgi:hypothetical protein